MVRAFVTAVLLAAAIPVGAVTLYVDPESTAGVEDGSAAFPYTTLAAVFAAVATGDKVILRPGTYADPLKIGIAVSIQAEIPLTAKITAPWMNHAAGTALRGLLFQGPGTGTALRTTHALRLEDSQIQGFDRGLLLKAVAGDVTVRHNRFLDNRRGVVLRDAGVAGSVIVENNVIVGKGPLHGHGIIARDSRWQGLHNFIGGTRTGIVHRNTTGNHIQSSRIAGNHLVVPREAVVGFDLEPGEVSVVANAFHPYSSITGIPAQDLAGNIADACGDLGDPWTDWPHDYVPTGACEDHPLLLRDPDGSAGNIGPYGGPAGGPWWQMSCVGPVVYCPSEDLATWLTGQPMVATSLVWWVEGAGWVPWSAWPVSLHRELGDVYDAIWFGYAAIQPVPPENLRVLSDSWTPAFTMTEAHARALFLSLAAQSLLVELQGLVPWSLRDQQPDALDVLLDGSKLMPWVVCVPGLGFLDPAAPIPSLCTDVAMQIATGRAIPAPGPDAWDWLVANGIIGATGVDTIANMVQWSRDNLIHFQGSWTAVVAEYYWGERGGVPVLEVLNGADPEGDHPSFPGSSIGFGHYTAGCHGTNTLYREVLRVALWLPEPLLDRRCEDLAASLPNTDGAVFAFLSQHYTMAELDSMGFWNDIDAEIAGRGGCGNY